MATAWADLSERLQVEWEELAGRAQGSVWRRWQEECAPLGRVERLIDLPGWLGGQDYQIKDEVLLALVMWAQGGSQLAGRTVLRLVAPGISRLMGSLLKASKGTRCTPTEVGEQVVGLVWEVMATYPVQSRPTRVAANLLMDARMIMLRGAQSRFPEIGLKSTAEAAEVQVQPTRLDELAAMDAWGDGGTAASPEEVLLSRFDTAESLFEGLLDWAVLERVITPADAELLRDVCAPAAGAKTYAYVEAAQARGISAPAVRQRTCRAIRRLREATAGAGAIDPMSGRFVPGCHNTVVSVT